VIGTGRVAVIAPPARVGDTAAALDLIPGPDLEAPVAVLTAEQAKGLEFDSVIIVDPAAIEQASPRGRADLYVALTRTTRRLGLISPGEMPRELEAVMDQVQRDGSAHSANSSSGILAGPGM
jgi:superfamily I DNA/RNA helicase